MDTPDILEGSSYDKILKSEYGLGKRAVLVATMCDGTKSAHTSGNMQSAGKLALELLSGRRLNVVNVIVYEMHIYKGDLFFKKRHVYNRYRRPADDATIITKDGRHFKETINL